MNLYNKSKVVMKYNYYKLVTISLFLFVFNTTEAEDKFAFTIDKMTFSLVNTKEVAIENIEVPKDGKVIFPSEILYNDKTFKVSTLGGAYEGDPWGTLFKNPEALVTVVIPSTINHISVKTTSAWSCCQQFYGCINLKKVIIEDSDMELFFPCNDEKSDVREALFAQCPLEEVYIGRNINYYRWERYGWSEMTMYKNFGSPFKKSKNLRKVEFSEKVTEIHKGMFFGCIKLEKIKLSDKIKEIPVCTFLNCSALSSIDLPAGLIKIDHYAFAGSALSSLILPPAVEVLGQYFCENCNSLKDIIINDKLKKIPYKAFNACNNIKNVVIGKSVERIEDGAFAGSNIQQIESKIEDPSKCKFNSDCFDLSTYTFATLYVPIGTKNKYENEKYNWGYFLTIVEREATEINDLKSDVSQSLEERFLINGLQINKPQKGINIIKMSDGTAKKIFVK